MPVRTSSTTVGSLDTSCDDDGDDDDDDDDGDGDDNEFDLLYLCTNPTSSKGMPQNFESVWWKQHSLMHYTLIHPGGRRKDMSSCLLVFPVLLSVISAVHFLGPLLCTKNASSSTGPRGSWICRAHLSNLLHVASDTGISNEGD